MKEQIEQNLAVQNFESDQERLDFFRKEIRRTIKKAWRAEQERSQKLLKEAGGLQKLSREQLFEYRLELDKRREEAIENALQELRGEASQNPKLKLHLTEANAMIDAIRIMYLSQGLVKYKEYQLMERAPQMTQEQIREQEVLREDLTENRALIQWYILQLEQEPKHLELFMDSLRRLAGEEGFKSQWGTLERGLLQELGIYKILRRKFKSVISATPKEDAHYGIDFWVETRSGKKVILQSKSSGLFGKGGVFSEGQIRELKLRLEREPGATRRYEEPWEGNVFIPGLVRIEKIEKDAEAAKRYAKEKGIENPIFFLIISNPGNFEYPSGEPKRPIDKKLENQLDNLEQL